MTAWPLWVLVLCLSVRGITGCSVQPMIKASKLSRVSISCPPIVGESDELRYLLLLNGSNIGKIQLKKQQPDSKEKLFSCQLEVIPTHDGVYVCKREIIYPPPFKDDCHSTEVKVDEEQPLPIINNTSLPASQSCPDRSPLIPDVVMWAACGAFLVYSLSITCITIVMWRKLKRHREDTSVYMNTRPAEARKQYKA